MLKTVHCQSAPPAHKLPDGTDSRKIAVLTRDDWSRLHFQLNKKAIERQRVESEKAEKLAMRDQSKAMISNWTNTLKGARKKRLEERQKRLDAKEAEAKLVDIEEARYQAEKRRDAIQKAKQLLYYQTDRVKEFHSALRLTETLKERDAQLELKKLRDLGQGEKDREWFELAERQRKEWEEQEAAKRENMRKAAMENTGDLVKQINEKSLERDKVIQRQRQEGDRLRQLGEDAIRDADEKANAIRQNRLQNMQANVRQMEERRMLQEKECVQNEADDDEIRIYVDAKKKLLRRRAVREQELDAEKRNHRERIYNKLVALHQARVDDEQQRFDKANFERDERERQEQEDRRRRIEEGNRAAAEHRAEQMRRLEEAKQEEKRIADETAKLQHEADVLHAKNEEEKARRRRQRAAELSQQYLKDGDEKRRMDVEVKHREIGEAMMNLDLQLHEEDMFQKYAKSVIDNLDSRGRNTIPLKRVVAKRPPVIVPSNLIDQTDEPSDGPMQMPATYKRLGFVYGGG